jgi:hypothetical protein
LLCLPVLVCAAAVDVGDVPTVVAITVVREVVEVEVVLATVLAQGASGCTGISCTLRTKTTKK